MACYPLATTAEGPGPRVGHASLLVGNAFIVYGGDTKMEDSDVLDETLYLLNTCRLNCGRFVEYADRTSNAAMVKSSSSRTSTIRTIRAFAEHTGLKDIRIRRSGGGIFHERFGCV